MKRPRSELPNVGGWLLFDSGDYAEPAVDGGGFVEVQDDGVFEFAHECSDELVDLGAEHFLYTRVPAEVIRALLKSYDEQQKASK